MVGHRECARSVQSSERLSFAPNQSTSLTAGDFMSKGLSASTIKSWFQYRCERKVRYELSSDEELAAVPVIKDVREQAWAKLGVDFEARVIDRLHAEQGVLQPALGDFGLSERLAAAFLEGKRREPFATQINLKPRAKPAFLEHTGLHLARTFPDLIRRDVERGVVTFTVIDIKATRRATPFHKTQVAFYVRVLEELLKEIGVRASISPNGEIWRIPDDGTADGNEYQADVFALGPYLRLVDEFCQEHLPAIAAKRVGQGQDDTFFHLYFKCEQCSFLEHCRSSISPPLEPRRWDLSAVPGVTHEAKRSLNRLSKRTVADLASSPGFGQLPGIGWSLSRRAPVLVLRAQAILNQSVLPTDEKQSFLMPPRVHATLLLSVDHDPVDNRIAALGYSFIRDGATARTIVEVPRSGSHADEADVLVQVLAPLIADLAAIDAENAEATDEQGVIAHIFLFEPAEALNLQKAVGRHLDDPRVREGLLNLVRLFPPEDVVPEPEFRGIHHLPATAVRSVLEQLFALPVAVSYDLRQVSAALAGLGGGPQYQPADGFERPFSSLLSIDVIRSLREGARGAKTTAQIQSDVQGRLEALHGVIEWLRARNEEATVLGSPLLRLSKKPFRFQETFDPLDVKDLDVLLACELLENRAGLLEALIRLAQPAPRRRDGGRCYAELSLTKHWQNGPRQFLNFKVPPQSREAELGPGDFNLILTNDDPDLRLDPGMWQTLRCQIQTPGEGFENRRDLLLVSMPRAAFTNQVMQQLILNTGDGGWFIDQAFGDVNTDKAARFFRDIAVVGA